MADHYRWLNTAAEKPIFPKCVVIQTLSRLKDVKAYCEIKMSLLSLVIFAERQFCVGNNATTSVFYNILP
jgi:hypothetical protein